MTISSELRQIRVGLPKAGRYDASIQITKTKTIPQLSSMTDGIRLLTSTSKSAMLGAKLKNKGRKLREEAKAIRGQGPR